MKKGIVKEVERLDSFEYEGTTFYPFNYLMENGDSGVANHKTNEPKFPKGSEAEYECFEKNGYPKMKIQKVGGYTAKGEPKSNSAFAMSYAKDLVVADKISLHDLSEYALLMKNWMDENK